MPAFAVVECLSNDVAAGKISASLDPNNTKVVAPIETLDSTHCGGGNWNFDSMIVMVECCDERDFSTKKNVNKT